MDILAKEGTIERTDSGFTVRVKGKTYLKGRPGVICENPKAKEAERIYASTFTRSSIYMPDEYDRAVRETLSGNDVIVLGMNGYSELNDEQCLAWGVRPGAYEQACIGILKAVYATLNTPSRVSIFASPTAPRPSTRRAWTGRLSRRHAT
ncbi:MAG: hypothetical protein R3D26_04115 [Cyanobacteriota/Melainabacteria group bacterium]